MKPSIVLDRVREIMSEFARITGLSDSGRPPRRYLWTDAFAVCNYLELFRRTAEAEYRELALRLVQQVHETLGRHREDDSRRGWISGLEEMEGARHPTSGGLRIGKPLLERRPGEPYDEHLEWERDGQYYHYLTKWMQALNQVSRLTGEYRYNRWAIELAKAAHARFVTLSPSGTRTRMVWKMSIDLSFPLVPAMGHHDPLDGLITYAQLQDTGNADPDRSEGLDLRTEMAEMALMCQQADWRTDDPLGLGGLLADAYRALQLSARGLDLPLGLPTSLLEASGPGLAALEKSDVWTRPADFRLAFRELGLAIGLRASDKIGEWLEENPGQAKTEATLRSGLGKIGPHAGLRKIIETFWLDRRNQAVPGWTNHREINMVMLAASLAPDGYLTIA